MKKIIVLGLSSIIALNLFACSKADVEKGPIVVSDDSENNINVSESQNNQDKQDEQDKQNQNLDTTPYTDTKNNLDSSNNTSSPITDTSDSQTQEKDNVFKAIIMMQGMEEVVNYRTYHSALGYRMNYDADRFTVTSENGIDTYMAENANPELYPYVFITIEKHDNPYDSKKLEGELHLYDQEIDQNLVTVSPKENVQIGNYDAIHFNYIGGNEWNSLVKNIYVIALENQYYVIKSNYFLEASEGYGIRINAMLDTIIFE